MDDHLATIYTAHVTVLKLRYDRALGQKGFDHAAVFAGSLQYPFLDDNAYPFRVNPHFKQWAPVVDNPNCWVVYTPGLKPKLLFWQPVDYWYKPADTPEGAWTGKFELVIIRSPDEARKHLPKGRIAFIGEWQEAFAEWGDLSPNPPAVLDMLHWDRAWKTEYEIECVRRANVRGARGHRAAEAAYRNGDSEYEIHFAYLRGVGHTEEEVPYNNIIATNEHCSVLHYTKHEQQPLDEAKRHAFLIDAGASYNGYASDITRTYSQRQDEFHELIDAFDAMQQSLVAEVRPKLDYRELHFLAHRRIAELLVRFRLVEGLDADGVVEQRISATFFPHGVGHFLGLQVHDVGGFMADPSGKTLPPPEGHPYLRLTRVVEPSMIFTVEPGLYFVDSLLAELKESKAARYVEWDRVETFRRYGGIRVEDDVVVTESGCDNLTRSAFASLAS